MIGAASVSEHLLQSLCTLTIVTLKHLQAGFDIVFRHGENWS